MAKRAQDILMQDKVFLWVGLGTVIILMVPLIAMQFSSEVNWDLADFIVIGTLLFGTGSIFVFSARRIRKTSSRVITGLILLVALLYVWAELAVGIFTNIGS